MIFSVNVEYWYGERTPILDSLLLSWIDNQLYRMNTSQPPTWGSCMRWKRKFSTEYIKMIQIIARSTFSIPMKAPLTRIMKLTSGTAKSRSITRVFDRFSSKIANDIEAKDIKSLEEFTKLAKYFEEFPIPFDHPINDIAEKIKALKSIDGSTGNSKDIQSVRRHRLHLIIHILLVDSSISVG